MATCSLSPTDKKLYGIDVGEMLVKNYGKKKYYTPAQVKQASAQSRYDIG